MKYNLEHFIKEYNYEYRRDNKLLKIDRRPIHKRMKHVLSYIAYFLKYAYDNNIHVKYSISLGNIFGTSPNQITVNYLLHTVNFSTDDYCFIIGIGRTTMDGVAEYKDLLAHLSLRLYKRGTGLETLATESITLDLQQLEIYKAYLNKETKKIESMFNDEALSWYAVQGCYLRGVLTGYGSSN